MHSWRFFALPTLIPALLSIPTSAPAQVPINIGAEPVCPCGYYDVVPYSCAPYGYFGPEWFSGGGQFAGASIAFDILPGRSLFFLGGGHSRYGSDREWKSACGGVSKIGDCIPRPDLALAVRSGMTAPIGTNRSQHLQPKSHLSIR
jgi:hypothetical protein